MPATLITSKSQFDTLLKSTPYLALQASASWCGPCKAISPLFEKHSDEHAIDKTYAFAKFDIDAVPDLASELGVRSVPTFFFFENGDKMDASVKGASPPSLKKVVEEVKAKAVAGSGGNTVSGGC